MCIVTDGKAWKIVEAASEVDEKEKTVGEVDYREWRRRVIHVAASGESRDGGEDGVAIAG